jgi:hypothetical protein
MFKALCIALLRSAKVVHFYQTTQRIARTVLVVLTALLAQFVAKFVSIHKVAQEQSLS